MDRSECELKIYRLHRYSEGTGSVIQEKGNREEVYARAGRTPDERVQILSELGLRYFSTREVAR